MRICKKFLKLALSALGLTWLVWHFFATFVYLVPSNLISRRFETTAAEYLLPLFRQNWHLFSPNPGFSDTELWIRCYSKTGHLSSWMDPFQELRKYHHATRVTGAGKLLYIYNNLSRDIVSEDSKVSQLLNNLCVSKLDKELPKVVQAGFGIDINELQPNISPCDQSKLETLRKLLVSKTPAFELPKKFAADFCSNYFAGEDLGFQIRAVEKFPKKFTERNSPFRFGQVTSITFDLMFTK